MYAAAWMKILGWRRRAAGGRIG